MKATMTKIAFSRFKIKSVTKLSEIGPEYISGSLIKAVLGLMDYERVVPLAAAGQIETIRVVRFFGDKKGAMYVNPTYIKGILKSPMRALLQLRLQACRRGEVTAAMVEQSKLTHKDARFVKKLADKVSPFTRPVASDADIDIEATVQALALPLAEPAQAIETPVVQVHEGVRSVDRMIAAFEQIGTLTAQVASLQAQTLAAIQSLERRWS